MWRCVIVPLNHDKSGGCDRMEIVQLVVGRRDGLVIHPLGSVVGAGVEATTSCAAWPSGDSDEAHQRLFKAALKFLIA